MIRTLSVCALVLLLPLSAPAGDRNRRGEAIPGRGYDLAIARLNAYIRANPYYAPAFNSRGVAYLRMKDYDQAIGDFTQAIRLSPSRVLPYSNRGLAYSWKKDFDKAIEDYSEAIRLNPTYARAFSGRGHASSGKKNYDKAIEDFTQVISLDPRSAYAFFGRGYAYKRKQQYDKTISDYSEAIRLNPNYGTAHNNLAWVLATCPKDALRDGKKAVEHATKACELSQWKNANQIGTLAAAYAESGEFKEAVKWEKKALELGYRDKDEQQKAAERLNLYEQSKPYREE